MATATTRVVQIEANILWLGYRDPETGHCYGVCQMLNLNAAGETWADMQAEANEAMALLFSDLVETDELPAFLQKNHWSMVDAAHAPLNDVRFDVPSLWQRAGSYKELVHNQR